jgi:hypothetical protein
LVRIDADDALEYSESLSLIGQGWWRQVAWAFRQGIPDSLGMERREWAETYHGYLKLPISDRREAVLELAAEGLNNSEIADALGVDESTVREDKKADSGFPEPEDVQPQIDEDENEADSGFPEPESEALPPAELSPEERDKRLREQEELEAIRRGRDRLLALVDGWVELTALPSNPFRDALLEGLNEHDRRVVQDIEAMYRKVGK